MKTLAAHGLTCCRGDRIIFQNLNFKLQSGEVLYLKGCNGSGKTSLLKMIGGFIPTNPYELEWGAHTPFEDSFFIGCRPAVKPFLTVLENLSFWANIYMSPSSKTSEALAFFELERLQNSLVSNLSHGQIQRVSLARLLLISKPIWLLDEPMTGLDQTAQNILSQLVYAHLAHGGLVLVTSHGAPEWQGNSLNLEDYQPHFLDSLKHIEEKWT